MVKAPAVIPAEDDGNAGGAAAVEEAGEAVQTAETALAAAEATGDEAAEEAAAQAIAEAVESVKEIGSWVKANKTKLEAAGEATPGLQSQLAQFQNTLSLLNQRLDKLEQTEPKPAAKPLTQEIPGQKPPLETPAPSGEGARPVPKTEPKKYRVI